MKKNINTAKGRKISSTNWLKRHINDSFVKRAQAENYRSRAAYKLIEIQNKFKILRPGLIVLDLGAAPGGWSQVAAALVGTKGKIYAIDRIDMLPLPNISNIQFIKLDLTKDLENDLESLSNYFRDVHFDIIMADLAPNTCGISNIDSIRSIELNKIVIETAQKFLASDGKVIIKIFQGVEEENFVKYLKTLFKRVIYFKPEASRRESREIYLVLYS